jgi:hypothetical protein
MLGTNRSLADRNGLVLDRLPEPVAGRGYPWALWMDGRPRTLRRGEDFRSKTTKGFRATLYAKAREHNVEVRVYLGRPHEFEPNRWEYTDEDLYVSFQFVSNDK